MPIFQSIRVRLFTIANRECAAVLTSCLRPHSCFLFRCTKLTPGQTSAIAFFGTTQCSLVPFLQASLRPPSAIAILLLRRSRAWKRQLSASASAEGLVETRLGGSPPPSSSSGLAASQRQRDLTQTRHDDLRPACGDGCSLASRPNSPSLSVDQLFGRSGAWIMIWQSVGPQ